MKTLQELRREVALNAREIHENEFRELIQIYERKGWMRIVRAEEVIIGDVYGVLLQMELEKSISRVSHFLIVQLRCNFNFIFT